LSNNLKPSLSKNILTLMSGTVLAQAIPIAISPILTRLYTPQDFGIFALYIAIVSFISIIVTARYELAIVLPKEDENAINILALSIVINFAIVIFLFLLIFFFKEFLLELLNARKIGNLVYLIPISILVAGLYQSFNYWSNRQAYFKNMASAQIAQSLTIGTTQPLFGYISIGSGLILGNFIGRVVSFFILLKEFTIKDKKHLNSINKNIMLQMLIKYKDFPLINSLHAFSDVVRSSGVIMLISSFFGTTTVGLYSLALRVLQVPVAIIGSALGQVLYQKFVNIYNSEEDLYRYVKEIVVKLILVAMPIFITLYIFAPDLFAFVFGEEWRVAGEYSKILVPYLFMNFILSPISQLPIILHKQKEFFYINLIGNLGVPLIVYLSYKMGIDFKNILYLITSLFLFLYTFILYWILNILKGNR